MDFEWDDSKAESNFKKHQVRFSEAVTVWMDENSLEMFDPDHSKDEDRWIRLGYSTHARILGVVYCKKLRVRKSGSFLQEKLYRKNKSNTIRGDL